MAKAPYKTKQMTEILTFLKSVQGRHVTVNEICDFFKLFNFFFKNSFIATINREKIIIC